MGFYSNRCCNQIPNKVKQHLFFFAIFHLRKVFCPVYWYLSSREKEIWRYAGSVTIQPSHVMSTITQSPLPSIVHSIHQLLLYRATDPIHLTQSKAQTTCLHKCCVYNKYAHKDNENAVQRCRERGLFLKKEKKRKTFFIRLNIPHFYSCLTLPQPEQSELPVKSKHLD